MKEKGNSLVLILVVTLQLALVMYGGVGGYHMSLLI